MKSLLLIFGTFVMYSLTATASDHRNPEQGLPVEIEDAYPIAFQGREMQARVGYDKEKTGEDFFTFEPRIEYGVVRNGEITVAAPFYTKEMPGHESGNLEVDALYNFFNEPLIFPAVSLAGGAEFPTSSGAVGIDPHIKLILTKTLPPQMWFHQIHLNAQWKYNSKSEPNERREMWKGVLGYSKRLATSALGLADFVIEQDVLNEKEKMLIEVGLRYQVTPLTVVGIGAGAGLNEESEDFRSTLSFQQEITFF